MWKVALIFFSCKMMDFFFSVFHHRNPETARRMLDVLSFLASILILSIFCLPTILHLSDQ